MDRVRQVSHVVKTTAANIRKGYARMIYISILVQVIYIYTKHRNRHPAENVKTTAIPNSIRRCRLRLFFSFYYYFFQTIDFSLHYEKSILRHKMTNELQFYNK